MIFGHLGMAWLCRSLFFRTEPLMFLTAASLGPDLVDKPLSLFFGVVGRGIGHTLLGFAAVCALAVLAWRFLGLRKGMLAAGVLLWLGHLSADFVDPVTLTWPLLGDLPASAPRSLGQSLYEFYILRSWPLMFWTDITFVGFAGLHALFTWLWNWRQPEVPAMQR